VIRERAYPVDPWHIRETRLDLDLLAQSESVFALSNGHIGIRGNLDEGEPHGLPGSYLNSFYELRPLPHAEGGYGFPESGQTMVNVKGSGSRTRISTFLAGVFLLVLVVVFGDVVSLIPMAALVAVMIFVSVATFDWHGIRPSSLRRMPKSETAVMVITVVATVLSHNLAIGVGLGVLSAMVLFARRVAHFQSVRREVTDASARYTVEGELFWASSNDLTTQFSYVDDPDPIVIDLSRSHIWDASTVAALDAIETKYGRLGKTVELVGLNAASTSMRDRMAGQLGGE
jgi:SulP family sulfate permease